MKILLDSKLLKSFLGVVLLAMTITTSAIAQSYDFSASNVQISDPTGITVGSSITLGTALDEVSFDIC